MDSRIFQFIFYMIALIFSLSVHEAMHAFMSDRFGDDLARHQGRISLNPISHVDPVGTLLFPAVAFFTGAPLLGWARPTPVNPLAWRNKRVANFWVSIAGILGNLTIAIVTAIIIIVLMRVGALTEGSHAWLVAADRNSAGMEAAAQLLGIFFMLNVGLAIFNLFPIPPLDGSKILYSILPDSAASGIEALERFGFMLLFIAVFTGVFGKIFGFVIPLAWQIVFLGAS
ncbi:MAG TPA: site-2 protease family protein [Pyrinomonadaceae bacterium]|nr:site-2 protease family protein [Pyrinomonadaceae bacterium]